MHIKDVRIRDYKRFADLTIQNIPASAKIVLLAGPNGSGKSSLIDAFLTWFQYNARGQTQADSAYYDRPGMPQAPNQAWNRVAISFHESIPTDQASRRRMFYFRSAYRNDPSFNSNAVQRAPALLDEARFQRMIELDTAVQLNYMRMAAQTLEETLVTELGTTTLEEYREKLIGDIRRSILRIFPDLSFSSLGNPIENGTFLFNKGAVNQFEYKNLSGGEKAAFDLVLDLIIKSKEYDDTIFCIDEPEAHLNARVQADVLEELTRHVPPASQLWIATHSIGMMRKARELAIASPGTVVFLDFADKDFDIPVVLEPIKPTRAFWERILSVAVHDMAHLIVPKRVIICEGNPVTTVPGKNDQVDADCYNEIFADGVPDAMFISAGNAHDVTNDRLKFMSAISMIAKGVSLERLIDKDDHSTADIARLNADGLRVLSLRNIESYLFDDDVLKALCNSYSKLDLIPQMLAAKNNAYQASIARGKPIDDLKPSRDVIYVEAKKILSLVGVGNDSAAFMRQVLAPLLPSVPTVYDNLRRDIFG